jgi:hypothetical protein
MHMPDLSIELRNEWFLGEDAPAEGKLERESSGLDRASWCVEWPGHELTGIDRIAPASAAIEAAINFATGRHDENRCG